MNIPFKHALVTGLLFGTVFTLGIYNDYQGNNDYTSQQISEVVYPTIVRRDCGTAGLGGYYNRQTNLLTLCTGYSVEQEAEILRHELVHFEQDHADGLDNDTHTLISGESVVQNIWNDDSLYPELKTHIKKYYTPEQYLIELEAYILQNYPLGYVLTYNNEVSK
jgi:hypothetical protein